MYKVSVQVRMDILGSVVDRLNIEVSEYATKKEAKKLAEQTAHENNCQKYGMPVHFIATTCSNWTPTII